MLRLSLKRLFLIKQDTVLAIILIGAVVFGVFFIYNAKETGGPAADPMEELYQDALVTMLLPHVQEAITEYYMENTGYDPVVDPWQLDILSIERPGSYRYQFIIKFEAMPYLGAHNSIGIDRITLKVSYKKVELEKYEHIKSYPIPPWLKHQEE